jgi:hypothetical protein
VLRRDPDALQNHDNTELARGKRLWALGWSHKSIARVTGLSVEQLRECRRGGKAEQQTEAPLKTTLSNDTCKRTINVHVNPKPRGKCPKQMLPRPAKSRLDLPHGGKAPQRLTPPQHKLPLELLHNILHHLSSKDIKALRQTCRTMASIGLEYIGAEVELISYRASFRSLSDITRHSALSRRIISLFYMCDRLNFDSLQLEKCWATPYHFSNQIPQRPTYELQSLREWFHSCRNIRQITVASETGYKRRLTTSNTFLAAHGQAIIEDEQKLNWTRTGVRQVLNVANAVVAAGTKLDSLTIAGVTYRLWDRHSDEEVSNLKLIVRPLRRLRVFTVAWTESEANYEDDRDEFQTMTDSGCDIADAALANSERFRDMLAEATELRVLKLQFSPHFVYDGDDGYLTIQIRLEDVLRNIQFSHLYDLAIGWCATTEAFLRKTILRHKTTLRRLTISHIRLLQGNVPHFIESIAGKLPHLRQVTLRGFNHALLWHNSRNEPDDQNTEVEEREGLKHAAESYVLGVGPRPRWNEHFIGRNNEIILWPGGRCNYKPPTRPEDDTRPDDPMWDYA